MHLIVDAHEDLAWNALTFGRDYTQSALFMRQQEQGRAAPAQNGHTLLGLSEYLLGHIAVIFSTLFAAPLRRRLGEWDTQAYADIPQAYRLYATQLDYYERLADDHEQFVLIRGRGDLEDVLATWEGDDLAQRRVGLVPLMAGADAIRETKEAEWGMERGVRIIGLAGGGAG